MGEKFLITGGEGFIGRNLKTLLIKEGKDVRTLDIDGKPDFRMSITDFDSLMSIDEKFDAIFHLAATTAPPQFEEDPLSGFNANANGTLNVLEFAKRKGIPKVILASSSAVYGDNHTISVENNVPDRYSNLYPVTKILNEYLARYYSIRGEVKCVSLRYFNTYGSGENTKGMYASPISKFLQSAMAGDPIIVYGDGTQSESIESRDSDPSKLSVVQFYETFRYIFIESRMPDSECNKRDTLTDNFSHWMKLTLLIMSVFCLGFENSTSCYLKMIK